MAEYFARCGTSRRVFAKAAFVSPSVVTRYFKGQRVAPREFLDAFAGFLAERGTPLSPQERADLDELRVAALAGSDREHNRALYWRETAERLAAEKDILAARLCEERARGDRDRVAAAEALGALELDLAELREALEYEIADRAAAETRRDTLQAHADEQHRRLDAAGAYTRELEGELAEHRATAELLRREVDVLRRQVSILNGENRPTTPAHKRVAPAATQVTADDRAAPTPEHRPSLPEGDGEAALGFRYPVSSRAAGEVSPELLAEALRRWEEWDRKRRARTDPTADPRYHRRLVAFRRLAVCLGLTIVIVAAIAVYRQDRTWGGISCLLFCAWLGLAGWCWGDPPAGTRETGAVRPAAPVAGLAVPANRGELGRDIRRNLVHAAGSGRPAGRRVHPPRAPEPPRPVRIGIGTRVDRGNLRFLVCDRDPLPHILERRSPGRPQADRQTPRDDRPGRARASRTPGAERTDRLIGA